MIKWMNAIQEILGWRWVRFIMAGLVMLWAQGPMGASAVIVTRPCAELRRDILAQRRVDERTALRAFVRAPLSP